MRFRATLLQKGKTATGFPIPDAVLDALGGGKRPPVRVTVAGHTWRSTPGSMDGLTMLPVSAENRAGAGLTAGDEADIDLVLDTEPREVTVPADLAEALDREPTARRFFDGLSHSVKQWHVLQVEGAKAAETRAKRVAKSVEMLREGRAR